MLESPRWLAPNNTSFHGHTVLNVYDPFCNSLESFSRVLSFDRITTFSLNTNRKWISYSEEFSYDGLETAAKIAIWTAAWLLIIPGVVLFTLKYLYLERIQEITKNSYVHELERRLETAENKVLAKIDIIAEVIRNEGEYARVVVDDGERFRCSAQSEWMSSWLPDVLLAHATTEAWQEENRRTMNFFANTFGEERCHRLFQMAGMDFDYRYHHGLPLTRNHVALFLALTAFVHVQDMHDIYDALLESAGNNTPYLHLSSEEVQNAAHAMKGAAFEQLTQVQYDLLWDIMTPLNLSTMFVNRPDKIKPDQNRGCEINSIIKALWIEQNQIRHHFNLMTQRDCDYTLIKSLTGSFTERETISIKGKVIRQKKGYGFLRSMISAAGCYCIPMEAMGKTLRENKREEKNTEGKYREDTYLSRLLILPTQAFASYLPQRWESMVGILQRNIGAKGVLALWPRIQRILKKDNFRRVDILGYSQGGTQAAKVATLALAGGHVRKLTKVCGTAEDRATAELFAELAKESEKEGEYAIKIRSIWQPSDRTHMAEDRELSTDAIRNDQERITQGQEPLIKQKIHWYRSAEEQVEMKKSKAPENSIAVIWEAFMAIIGPHAEDVTVDGNHYVESYSTVTDRNAVLEQLDNEPFEWEPVRKMLSGWLYAQSDTYFADGARKLLNRGSDSANV